MVAVSLTTAETFTDGDGNTYESEVTDWELCYSEQYIDDTSVWTLDRSFDDCRGPIEWEKDKLEDGLNKILPTLLQGETYTGPTTWEEYVEQNIEVGNIY